MVFILFCLSTPPCQHRPMVMCLTMGESQHGSRMATALDYWVLLGLLVQGQDQLQPHLFRPHPAPDWINKDVINVMCVCVIALWWLCICDEFVGTWYFEWATRWTRMSLRIASFRNGGVNYICSSSWLGLQKNPAWTAKWHSCRFLIWLEFMWLQVPVLLRLLHRSKWMPVQSS